MCEFNEHAAPPYYRRFEACHRGPREPAELANLATSLAASQESTALSTQPQHSTMIIFRGSLTQHCYVHGPEQRASGIQLWSHLSPAQGRDHGTVTEATIRVCQKASECMKC